MARKDIGGRYEVGDHTFPSLGMALGWAQHQAGREGRPTTYYVREIGKQGVLRTVIYDPEPRTTITSK